jgi:hypothetical protein
MKLVAPDRGSLVISIDLELAPGQRMRLDDQRRLASTTDLLIEALRDHDLAATWAVADPAVSAATEVVLAADASHDVAVLGDHTWVGPSSGRTRFARELSRRVLAAQAAGIGISTLVLRDVMLIDDLDLLVKHGITAVRDAGTASSNLPCGAEPIRYSVWRMGATHRLGDVAAGRLGACGAIGRAVSRAAARAEACHLVLDAAQLAQAGTGAARRVNRVLRRIAQLRDREALSVRTMAQTARALAPARVESPARSILHPAA